MTRPRRWWFHPLLLGLVLALTLAIAEAAVRLAWSPGSPRQPVRWGFDPELGLAHIPGRYELPFRRCLAGQDCEDVRVRFTVDDQGFRATGNAQRTGGRPLVVVLGDSMIEAAQVDDGRTMCSVLERRLRSRFPGAAVRNAGISSAGFVHYHARWQKLVAPLRPDVLVVASFGLNDFRNGSPDLEAFHAMRPHYSRSAAGRRQVRFQPAPNPHSRLRRFAASLYQPLELVRFLRWSAAVRAEAGRSERGGPAFPPDAHIYEEPPPARYAEAVELGREYLHRLVQEARSQGARVVVVYLPWDGEALDEAWNALSAGRASAGDGGRLVRDRPERIVRTTAEAAGADFVSFSDVVRALEPAERRSLWHTRTDSHLTEQGNRLLAGLLAPTVGQILETPDGAPEGGTPSARPSPRARTQRDP
ncbi:MAG TPA: GDSL-type esterase/lipase family protein [Thermoanaerobaculia bacterium]|nr:GDSL-type esterase/lipase family protein [Thermoanaerobaculia bacterium]